MNAFQRTMVAWNSLHAYNAVHVVRIAGVANDRSLRTALERVLQRRLLAGVSIDSRRGTFFFSALGPPIEIRFLDPGNLEQETLAAEIERQINTPFDLSGTICPMRCFVLPGDGHFRLGIAYLHAIGDAESVVLLMKEAVASLAGRQESEAPVGSPEASTNERNSLRPNPGVLFRKLVELPSQITSLRRSCRPSYSKGDEQDNGFMLLPVEPAMLGELVAASKVWQTTVNDVLLSLLMKACAPLARERVRSGLKGLMSVGCIVNTRRAFVDNVAPPAFGLQLGSFVISQPIPDLRTTMELAKDIARLTALIKKNRLYLGTGVELMLGRWFLAFFSTANQKKLYQKYYPLWGGLTNMNINSLWPTAFGNEPSDYVRAVSTGPVTPLVLSFTTSGRAANIGLSFRTTVFSKEQIHSIASFLVESLKSLKSA